MSLLQFEAITLVWHTRRLETTVFRDFSLEVNSGESIALMGPNGCGKSTLLRLATGLLSPSAGVVRWGEKVIYGAERKRAYVPQNPHLFPWMRVWENVAFGLRLKGLGRNSRKARALELLERLGLASWSEVFPDSLSGGMRARVAMAMAFAPGPEVVCLDESLGPLDFQTREVVLKFIREESEKRNMSVLLVTHHVAEALRMERIVVMSSKPASVVLDIPVPQEKRFEGDGFRKLREAEISVTTALGQVSQEAFLRESQRALP